MLDIKFPASTQMLHKQHFSYCLMLNIKAHVANSIESCCNSFMASILQIHHADRISLWSIDSEKGGVAGMNSLLPYAGTVRLLGVAHYHHQPTASVWMGYPPWALRRLPELTAAICEPIVKPIGVIVNSDGCQRSWNRPIHETAQHDNERRARSM